MNHQHVQDIKHDMRRRSEMMMTRADVPPQEILDLIEFLENENKQLSLQIVNLTASGNK